MNEARKTDALSLIDNRLGIARPHPWKTNMRVLRPRASRSSIVSPTAKSVQDPVLTGANIPRLCISKTCPGLGTGLEVYSFDSARLLVRELTTKSRKFASSSIVLLIICRAVGYDGMKNASQSGLYIPKPIPHPLIRDDLSLFLQYHE